MERVWDFVFGIIVRNSMKVGESVGQDALVEARHNDAVIYSAVNDTSLYANWVKTGETVVLFPSSEDSVYEMASNFPRALL